ncbi:hypothetical protein VP01_60g2 [Puccinia sorghi]|uniref:Uncharacterized protein n=1 Tax=Puccinia sorghi TaxID=27349 RepID=A0A0L6UJ48_9BASI|nr:hypothetical protein VP01_60g2 [Puccinia sorghi]
MASGKAAGTVVDVEGLPGIIVKQEQLTSLRFSLMQSSVRLWIMTIIHDEQSDSGIIPMIFTISGGTSFQHASWEKSRHTSDSDIQHNLRCSTSIQHSIHILGLHMFCWKCVECWLYQSLVGVLVEMLDLFIQQMTKFKARNKKTYPRLTSHTIMIGQKQVLSTEVESICGPIHIHISFHNSTEQKAHCMIPAWHRISEDSLVSQRLQPKQTLKPVGHMMQSAFGREMKSNLDLSQFQSQRIGPLLGPVGSCSTPISDKGIQPNDESIMEEAAIIVLPKTNSRLFKHSKRHRLTNCDQSNLEPDDSETAPYFHRSDLSNPPPMKYRS